MTPPLGYDIATPSRLVPELRQAARLGEDIIGRAAIGLQHIAFRIR